MADKAGTVMVAGVKEVIYLPIIQTIIEFNLPHIYLQIMKTDQIIGASGLTFDFVTDAKKITH